VHPCGGRGVLTINVNYDASVNGAPAGFKPGIAAAVSYLESHFTDPVNVNINVGWGELGGDALPAHSIGASSFFLVSESYASLRGALVSDAKSADDQSSVASLPLTDPTFGGNFWASSAEAKALGLISDDMINDGSVAFDTATAWDFNASDGVPFGQYDFVSVAIHEISEVMGRAAQLGGAVGSTGNSYMPLDLFRFTGPDHRSFSSNDFAYFSTDNGHTNLDNFNSDPGGDFGDWADSPDADAFAAVQDSGVASAVTPVDLSVMDVIGWDTTSGGSPAPPPPVPPSPPPPPDLVASALTADANVISWHVANIGASAAPQSTTGLFLSTDSTVTSSDILVTTYPEQALASGSGETDSVSLASVLSQAMAPGLYYMAAIANYQGVVTEADGSNNTSNALPIWLGNFADNVLATGPGADLIIAFGGNDTITAGAGNDTIDGGDGIDTAVFGGALSAYSITNNSGVVTVVGPDGTDLLTNVEKLQFDDQTISTPSGALLNGTAGNDFLSGTASDDIINGGAGDDVLRGGPGNDTLDGGPGVDNAFYDTAPSGVTVDLTLQGSAQDTHGAGIDTLSNIENLYGSPFGDTFTGDGGSNSILGNGGNDVINGGGGNDYLMGGPGNDTIDGGAGVDIAAFSGPLSAYAVSFNAGVVTVSGPDGVDSLTNVEKLAFSDQTIDAPGPIVGQTIIGTAGNDFLAGGAGNDSLSGLAGDDVLQGGLGNDTLDGGAGTDNAFYDNAPSGVTVNLAISGPQDTHGAGTDTLISIENLYGSPFGDTLTGNSGPNSILGNGGNDTIDGGGGGDYLDGGAGVDTVSFASAPTGVTISLAAQGQGAQGGPGIGALLLNFENLTGSAFADSLTGDNGNNVITGGGGNDTINGGNGDDTAVYSGNFGSYVVTDVSGVVTVSGPDGNDTLTNIEHLKFADQTVDVSSLGGGGGGGGPTITGTSGNDFLVGTPGNDWISAGAGDDVLQGGAGNDTLDGGPGTDNAFYDNASSGVTVSLTVSGPQPTGGAGTDTLISIENLYGSPFGDSFIGNGGSNSILGNGGDDTIDGGVGGNDYLDGGAGNDTASFASVPFSGLVVSLALQGSWQTPYSGETVNLNNFENLQGSPFNDVLTGDANNNIITGGAGNDTIDGGAGIDTAAFSGNFAAYAISVGSGVVTISGPDGSDTLTNIEKLKFADQTVDVSSLGGGGGGGPTITGTPGNDFLVGTAGADWISAGAGDDVLQGGPGNDTLDGGPGIDNAFYDNAPTGVTVSLAISGPQDTGGAGIDTLISIENLYGSPLGDTLTGDGGSNSILGNGGNDVLNGGGGADYLMGGAGNDTIDGGAGVDTAAFSGALASYSIVNNSGTLTISGPDGTDTVTNVEYLAFSDQTIAAPGAAGVTLTGTSGNDFLVGTSGNDSLSGLAGDDVLQGGAGDDTLDGGTGTDNAFYDNAASGVTVDLTLQGSPQNTIGAGNDTLISIENLYGSNFADTLTGDNNANSLSGNGGNDTLSGGGGNDVLYGGSGSDSLTGGAGNDVFLYLALSDSTQAAPDVITDFTSGDKINLAPIGPNFQIGDGTHAGDVVIGPFDAVHNRTVIDIYSAPNTIGAEIWLLGNHLGLTAADFVF
jgi:Ca2+-binding RTX toxin-like protein